MTLLKISQLYSESDVTFYYNTINKRAETRGYLEKNAITRSSRPQSLECMVWVLLQNLSRFLFRAILTYCDFLFFTTLQSISRHSFACTIDKFLCFSSFLESCGTNSIFVNYCSLPIVVIPFHLSTASTYTCLYRFIRY